MQKEMERAIGLRNEQKYKESNELLMKLVGEFPGDAIINYHCAWSLDLLGKE